MGKRDDILNATLELIIDEGLQSVTFAKIFKRAHVGSGTVYNYFNNKEQLVNALFSEVIDHMSNYMIDGYDINNTLENRFNFFVKRLANYATEYPQKLWFIETYFYSPYIHKELFQYNKTKDAFFNILKEGQETKVIKDIPLSLCAQMVIGLVLYVINGALNNQYPLNNKTINYIIDSCWSAIKTN